MTTNQCKTYDSPYWRCIYEKCDHAKRAFRNFCPHHDTLQYVDIRLGLDLPREHYESMGMSYVENPDKELR